MAATACGPTPQQLAEAQETAASERAASCRAAGFQPDTDAFRLCLQIAQVNDRLDVLDGRVRRLEFDSFRPSPFFYGPYPYRWAWP